MFNEYEISLDVGLLSIQTLQIFDVN